MSESELGETLDIHGGGLDLIFPHHENEIAQSVCAHDGHPFAHTWLHNGMLTVDGVKMAKSEGNFITVREILAEAPGEVVRLALLGTHYRDPLDWTSERLQQARQSLDRFYRATRFSPSAMIVGGEEPTDAARDALSDDLNVPLAIAHLHELSGAIYRCNDPSERGSLQRSLLGSARLMGLIQGDPKDWWEPLDGRFENMILEQISARSVARKQRDFARADHIRTELSNLGIVLEDKPDGTTEWHRKA